MQDRVSVLECGGKALCDTALEADRACDMGLRRNTPYGLSEI